MGISGIDPSSIIPKTTEYAKDNTIQLKKPELTQQQLAVQVKQNDEHEQQTVIKSAQGEMVSLHPDDDSNAGGGYEARKGRDKKEKEDEEAAPGTIVPPGNNTIDIMI